MATEYQIKDIAKIVGGGTPKTTNEAFFGGDIPWITPKDMSSNRSKFTGSGTRNITKEGLESCSAKMVPKGAILMSSRAPIGLLTIAENELCTNQGIRSLIVDSSIADNEYVYYKMQILIPLIEAYSSGSTFSEISGGNLGKIPIKTPSLKVQQEVAGKLRIYEQYRRNLIRTKSLIDEMIEGIFNAFFIEFLPVKDEKFRKTLSIPEGDSWNFPKALVDSEHGPIPEGWRIRRISDVMDLKYGKALKAEDRIEGGDFPVYGSNGIVGYHDEKLVDGPGIVIGRKGNAGTVEWAADDFFPIDTTFYVAQEKGKNIPLEFLYFSLSTARLPWYAADTAVPGINRNVILQLPIIIPPKSVMEQFSSLARSVLEISANITHRVALLSEIEKRIASRLIFDAEQKPN